MASFYSGTMAEKYDIPYALTIAASTVPAQTCKKGEATMAMVAPTIIIRDVTTKTCETLRQKC